MIEAEKYIGVTKLTLSIQEVFYINKCKSYYEEAKLISQLITTYIEEKDLEDYQNEITRKTELMVEEIL